jgi:lipopolysaccharide biosynthesis protein
MVIGMRDGAEPSTGTKSDLRGSATYIDGLTADWNFQTGRVLPRLRLQRCMRVTTGLRPAPRHQVLKPIRAREAWMLYFVYAPDGCLTPAHEFTLARLRDMGTPLLVVCATQEVGKVPRQLFDLADSLYWKSLDGYDFSAYSLGLHAVAAESAGATVCVMNDSVFGPFSDLRPLVSSARWQLTGFTASSLVENHIQSYAFSMRDVRAQTLAPLRTIFPMRFAFDHAGNVILFQELRFARVASRHMGVGALWYSPDSDVVADPALMRPFELVATGFPFVKRSLVGKHPQFQSRDGVLALLSELRHPVPSKADLVSLSS